MAFKKHIWNLVIISMLFVSCQSVTNSDEGTADTNDDTNDTETVEQMDFNLQSHPHASTVDTDPEFRIEINGEIDETFQLTGIESGRNGYTASGVSVSGVSTGDEVRIVPDEPVGNYDIVAEIGAQTYSGVTGRDSDGSLSHEFNFVFNDEPKGTIEITTTTNGSPSSTNQYDVEVDGIVSTDVGQNATAQLNKMGEGIHHIALQNIPNNCSLANAGHHSVDVTANEMASTSFEINCGSGKDLVWSDDFETYSTNSWPQSNWVNSGNSDGYIDGNISRFGSQSFRLYGEVGDYWATLAYRKIEAGAPWVFEFYVRNGSEDIPSSGHQDRAAIDMETDSGGENRRLLDFHKDGYLYANGQKLGQYKVETWYKVAIKYEYPVAGKVQVTYWLNDQKIAQLELSPKSYEENLTDIGITAQAGSVWYDNVKILKVK